MGDSPQSVRLTVDRRVGWIEYARPPVNAINWQMLDAIHDAIAAMIGDPQARVVVLASAVESYFSAGADLKEFKDMRGEAMHRWVDKCHQIVRLLRHSPKPLLAAINGTAVGGGLEMTLHCDLRLAADNARFGQPEIQIAFIPPVGTTQALARLLGRPKAIRYLYEGRTVSAAEALDWGLIDEIVPAQDLRRRVQSYGEELAAKPAAALAAIRRTVTLGGGMTFEDGLALERDTATALADTADFAEGIEAFLQKRRPQWSGS
jgi:enoyl-CoA hydratase/carnithine racemase